MALVFSDRVRSVVAPKAISRDTGVIEICRQPGHGRMAIVTIIAAGNVALILASSDSAVVTRAASAYDLGMVNSVCRAPDCCVMAVLANIAGRNVIGGFAGGIRSVVTTTAIAGYVCVIEVRWNPAICGVTGVAIISARYVRRTLANRN